MFCCIVALFGHGNAYPTTDVRRLILKVERSQRILMNVLHLADGVQDAWRRHVGGQQPSLFALKQVLPSEQPRGVIEIAPDPNVLHY